MCAESLRAVVRGLVIGVAVVASTAGAIVEVGRGSGAWSAEGFRIQRDALEETALASCLRSGRWGRGCRSGRWGRGRRCRWRRRRGGRHGRGWRCRRCGCGRRCGGHCLVAVLVAEANLYHIPDEHGGAVVTVWTGRARTRSLVRIQASFACDVSGCAVEICSQLFAVLARHYRMVKTHTSLRLWS